MRGWWVEGGRVAVVFNFFCTRAVFLVYFLAPWKFFSFFATMAVCLVFFATMAVY